MWQRLSRRLGLAVERGAHRLRLGSVARRKHGRARKSGRRCGTASTTAEQAARGKIVYDGNCGACHLPDMSGSDEARPLAGERFMQDWRRGHAAHTVSCASAT